MEWPELDCYWAGLCKDLIPLFRCRYEVEHRNFLSHSGAWLGATGQGWHCHFIIIMFRTIEWSMEWPELD